MRGGKLHWPLEAHLLDDLRMVWTGSKDKPAKPHPSRPVGQKRRRVDSPERRRKLADARRRAHQRRLAIEAGEIT